MSVDAGVVNEKLQQLVIYLSRNLLQYINESWPWVGEHAESKEVLQQIVSKQNESIKKLVELLEARGQIVDFGSYPDYSEYHYIALEYVLERLVKSLEGILEEIQAAKQACKEDEEAYRIILEIEKSEQENLSKLKTLLSSYRSSVNA